MNYLELCKRALIEGGVSGSYNTLTTVGATGEFGRFCTWINQAWEDIQTQRDDWLFMRKTAIFNLIANQAEYETNLAPMSLVDYGNWVEDSFRIYKDTINTEYRLQQIDYNTFRDIYLLGSTRNSYGMPIVVTVSPSQSLIFALPPDYTYTVIADYQRTPSSFSLDTDTPNIPPRFHMMIVYRALMHYGAFESYPEKFSRAEIEYRRLMAMLEIDQLPKLIRCGVF